MNKINKPVFLYSLLNTFKDILKLKLCSDSIDFIQQMSDKFDLMKMDDKIHYTKYAMDVATSLHTVYAFEAIQLNLHSNDAEHDIKLINNNKSKLNVMFSTESIKVKNIIPNKLMKQCGYIKSTNVYKKYTESYNTINDNAYSKFSKVDKFSDLTDCDKNKYLLVPMVELIVSTLSRKKKHAKNLYNSIIDNSNRIVLRLYKNRFILYNFCTSENNDIQSFKISIDKNNLINIVFNNGAHFIGNLIPNSTEIKEKLSLKLKIKFKNMDEIYKSNKS